MKYYYITPADKEEYSRWYSLHRVKDKSNDIYYYVEGNWLYLNTSPSIYNLYRDVTVREITRKELNRYMLLQKLGK